jgi:NADPH2:quinone reductase
MRAIRIAAHGGPEALRLEEIPVPKPGSGQALVRIEAAGVNFIDVYQRTGLYQVPLPFTLGQEAAGTVEAVGDGVTALRPGARVAWTGVLGAYAEAAVVSADRLVEIPEAVTPRQAAAVMLQGMTAHYLVCSIRPLQPGDACLVHAAAGGTGQLLCRLAKLRGATVIGTVGSDAKLAVAREAGADHVLNRRTTPDLAAEVRRLTGGAGVQVVYDGVGAATFEASLAALASRGMLATFGNASGPAPKVEPLELSRRGSLFLTRPKLADYVATRGELEWRAREVLGWVKDGTLVPRIWKEYALADAAQAHRDLESRATTGKLLVLPQASGREPALHGAREEPLVQSTEPV